MAASLIFVDEDERQADELAARFSRIGWVCDTASPLAENAEDRIVEHAPVAAVFCLDRAVDRQLQVAAELVEDERIGRPLIVFVGGSEDDVERAKQTVPFGAVVRIEELGWVLKHLVPRS